MFFLEKCVWTAAKTKVVDRKYRKAIALPCLMSEPSPNAVNSSDVLRLDSMLLELRKLLCYDKHGCFSWENLSGLPQKPWLWTEKKQKALALLGLASGPLPNAVNSSVVPTELAAEPTTKNRQQRTDNKDVEGKFSNLNFLPSPNANRELSIPLNFFFPFIDI